jgi:hypothetical protein
MLLAVAQAERLPEPHIVPVSGGGLQLEWYSDTHALEFLIDPHGGFEYVLVHRPDDIVKAGELPLTDEGTVRDSMRWFLREDQVLRSTPTIRGTRS